MRTKINEQTKAIRAGTIWVGLSKSFTDPVVWDQSAGHWGINHTGVPSYLLFGISQQIHGRELTISQLPQNFAVLLNDLTV
jgi:hypothetical protein